MDNQDRQNTLAKLETTSEWTIWKTRDKEWSPALRKAGFSTYTQTSKRNAGVSRSKDGGGKEIIRTTKTRKSFECWVKTILDVPTRTQESLAEALIVPQHNVGKDVYTVDLEINEKLYWLVTESGLLGAFGFEGACTGGG
jgi:hypothetical protein